MPRIDSHQHFWKYDPARDSWISEDMLTIRRDFLPPDLAPLLVENNIEGCVVVQSDQSEAENEFQLDNATHYPFIKAVVGWVDLQADDVEDRLAHWSQYEKMKGFRHVLQGEKDRAFMLRPTFLNGISLLEKYHFTYDILIFPDQLIHTIPFVKKFPTQRFVIDHLAKPPIREQDINDWKRSMTEIAQCENVFCKISGMVTEADWYGWTRDDFRPYLDAVVEAFGMSRLMFGSDWPVCLVAGSYGQVVDIVKDYFADFSASEQSQFFGDNAMRFYNLK